MRDVHTHSLFQAWHYLQTGNNKKNKGEVRLNQRQRTQCSFILYAAPWIFQTWDVHMEIINIKYSVYIQKWFYKEMIYKNTITIGIYSPEMKSQRAHIYHCWHTFFLIQQIFTLCLGETDEKFHTKQTNINCTFTCKEAIPKSATLMFIFLSRSRFSGFKSLWL